MISYVSQLRELQRDRLCDTLRPYAGLILPGCGPSAAHPTGLRALACPEPSAPWVRACRDPGKRLNSGKNRWWRTTWFCVSVRRVVASNPGDTNSVQGKAVPKSGNSLDLQKSY